MNYQPKGGMCMTCVKRTKDCSHLPFKDMPVIARYPGAVIVKCTEREVDDSVKEMQAEIRAVLKGGTP